MGRSRAGVLFKRQGVHVMHNSEITFTCFTEFGWSRTQQWASFDSNMVVLASLTWCRVQFTPTIDHCSLATLIGLCIRTQLARNLPFTYKIDVSVRLRSTLCGRPESTMSLCSKDFGVPPTVLGINAADNRRWACIRGASQQAAEWQGAGCSCPWESAPSQHGRPVPGHSACAGFVDCTTLCCTLGWGLAKTLSRLTC